MKDPRPISEPGGVGPHGGKLESGRSRQAPRIGNSTATEIDLARRNMAHRNRGGGRLYQEDTALRAGEDYETHAEEARRMMDPRTANLRGFQKGGLVSDAPPIHLVNCRCVLCPVKPPE